MKSKLMRIFSKLFTILLDLVFPIFCVGCRKEGAFVCTLCLESIPSLQQQQCPYCLFISDFGRTCSDCLGLIPMPPLDGVFVYSLFEKGGLLQKLIHSFKYEYIEGLAEPLGTLVSYFFRHNSDDISALCPVPLHIKRLRWRGFNQAELLALVVGRHSEIPVISFLKRAHYRTPQMELSRELRQKNLEGSFEIDDMVDFQNIKTGTVVLVDDVATTLSTLEACARVLKKAGVKRVYGLVLARALKN